MKFNKEIVLTFLLSLCVYLIPSIIVSTMNLENSIVPQFVPNSEWNYNYTWIPVTASIYLSKCFCYTVGTYFLYKGISMLIKK